MNANTVYNFSDEDANWEKTIEESFNLVWDFCRELYHPTKKAQDRTPQRLAFNRIMGGEFGAEDVATLQTYAGVVTARVREKYAGRTIFAACPWKDAVLQNADRLDTVMTEFVAAFHAPQEAVV